jgi:hypothetical protein
MQLLMMLFSACFVASLFNVEMAVSKTTSPPQTVSAAYQQAMERV